MSQLWDFDVQTTAQLSVVCFHGTFCLLIWLLLINIGMSLFALSSRQLHYTGRYNCGGKHKRYIIVFKVSNTLARLVAPATSFKLNFCALKMNMLTAF